ncbi:MAG: endonuclease/exonuclease/phosphatase family protein [Pirellulaceae bacterium]
MKNFLGLLALGLALSLSASRTSLAEETPESAIKVMSFNIRFGSANDGENRWENRKEFVAETIHAYGPDLLGTQETEAGQRDFLVEKLPGYGQLGVGRADGQLKGEMMALFYKEERFEKLDGGHFWLSENPDQVGSKSWDSSLPRMVTWVKLRDKKQEDAKPVLFLNTHFDHRGPTARLESARLIRRKAQELGEGCSVIVTGDFNAGEGSAPYKAMFGTNEGAESPVVDTYRVAHPERKSDEGTFSGFKEENTGGARIDWIGVSRDWKILGAKIDRTAKEGRTPSDHFPITAEVSR